MSSRNEIYKEVTMTHKEKEEEDLYFDTIIIIKVYKLVGSYLKLKGLSTIKENKKWIIKMKQKTAQSII